MLISILLRVTLVYYSTAKLPLHQISGRSSICDPLGDYNVWTIPQGIPADLSNKRIILVATKVSEYYIQHIVAQGYYYFYLIRMKPFK